MKRIFSRMGLALSILLIIVPASTMLKIRTPQSQKTLLILPHSRHGAEGPDIPVMQKAIRDFIERAIAEVKAGGQNR